MIPIMFLLLIFISYDLSVLFSDVNITPNFIKEKLIVFMIDINFLNMYNSSH